MIIDLASESSARSLRSSSGRKCSVTRVHSRFGDMFCCSWTTDINNLPASLRDKEVSSTEQNWKDNWKLSCFRRIAAHRDFLRLTNTVTYLLTYLPTYLLTYLLTYVAGPTMFNTLPDDLRDPAVSTSTFGQSLKTHLFSAYQHV